MVSTQICHSIIYHIATYYVQCPVSNKKYETGNDALYVHWEINRPQKLPVNRCWIKQKKTSKYLESTIEMKNLLEGLNRFELVKERIRQTLIEIM